MTDSRKEPPYSHMKAKVEGIQADLLHCLQHEPPCVSTEMDLPGRFIRIINHGPLSLDDAVMDYPMQLIRDLFKPFEYLRTSFFW